MLANAQNTTIGFRVVSQIPNQRNLLKLTHLFPTWLPIYFAKSFSAKEKFVHFFSHFLEEKRVVKS